MEIELTILEEREKRKRTVGGKDERAHASKEVITQVFMFFKLQKDFFAYRGE